MPAKKSKETPRRFRDAKISASVGSIQDRIERDYGLPEGSIYLQRPNGAGRARADKRIGALLKEWGML
jgi:hypothetical protein